MPEMPRHQCMMYRGSPAANLPALASMIRLKLQENNRCLCLNSPPMVNGLRAYLFAQGLDADKEIGKGSLVLSSATGHLMNGRFDTKLILALLDDAMDQALKEGFEGLFATGDMTWEFGPERDFSKLVDYERRLEDLFRKHATLHGICQYHTNTLPPKAVQQGISTHPAIFINETLSQLNSQYVTPQMEDDGSV
jgi:MEDS: MEthanogen/methylotroph, DcmR Sensory domain